MPDLFLLAAEKLGVLLLVLRLLNFLLHHLLKRIIKLLLHFGLLLFLFLLFRFNLLRSFLDLSLDGGCLGLVWFHANTHIFQVIQIVVYIRLYCLLWFFVGIILSEFERVAFLDFVRLGLQFQARGVIASTHRIELIVHIRVVNPIVQIHFLKSVQIVFTTLI